MCPLPYAPARILRETLTAPADTTCLKGQTRAREQCSPWQIASHLEILKGQLMALKDDQLRELTEFADRTTMREIQFPSPRPGEAFPLITYLVNDVLSSKNRISHLLLPEIRTPYESIVVYSDYGGESGESKFKTFSFLVCAFNGVGYFNKLMRDLRTIYFPDMKQKEYAFKDRRFGPIKRSLSTYLGNLEAVPGLLFVLIIDERVKGLLERNDVSEPQQTAIRLASEGLGIWSPKIAQKVLWMTDHDSITAGHRHQQALNMLTRNLQFYTSNQFDLIGGAVPYEERDIDSLDLLSAADLVAGAFEHYFTAQARAEQGAFYVDDQAITILRWFANQSILLRKQAVAIYQQDDGRVRAESLELVPNPPPPNSIVINIDR